MRIISERRIREFWESTNDAESSFREWIYQVRMADWTSFVDVHKTFNSTDLHNGLLIFNVGGNKFRVIAKVEYKKHLLFIKTVLTHKEYDVHNAWCDCKEFKKRR